MPSLLLIIYLIFSLAVFAEDKYPTHSPMPICDDQNTASANPCAQPPKPKSTPAPQYTEEARQAHAEGTVVLQVLVKPDGTVGDITVLKSFRKGLDNNAMEAVSKWKFSPATYQGKPVAVLVAISLKFQLDSQAKSSSTQEFDRRKQCEADLPDLRRALNVYNNGIRPYFDLADCLMDLGREKEAIGYLENAAEFSRSPAVWNNAAYHLASHEVALDRAVKWANDAVIAQSREVHNTSRNHLSTDHLVESRRLITFWDTLGWVYFMRDDFANAVKYLAPGFALWQDPTLGQHLAQAYEKMGKNEDAIRVYAMAIAAEDRLTDTNPELVARLRSELSGLVPNGNLAPILKSGQEDLTRLQTLSIPNSSSLSGTADFLVGITASQIKEARQVSGGDTLKAMVDILRTVPVKYEFPDGADLLFTERGRLNCEPGANTCEFVLLSPLDALKLAVK
ncbi:MAG TPA: TonB family protein [Terriglobales bacterium]|nr:TonB family protein [Terriglobales bacterium]